VYYVQTTFIIIIKSIIFVYISRSNLYSLARSKFTCSAENNVESIHPSCDIIALPLEMFVILF